LIDTYDLRIRKEKVDTTTYNYFEHNPSKKTYECPFLKLVYDLASRVICGDPMGTNLYFYNIFGLTTFDMMQLDYATFEEYDKLATKIADDFLKELNQREAKRKTLLDETKE
jgi:hypothetical protein